MTRLEYEFFEKTKPKFDPETMNDRVYNTIILRYYRDILSRYQKHKCVYCDRQVGVHSKKRDPTFDHVIPKCLGGEDSLKNGVMACYRCNSLRGITPFEDFFLCVKTAKNEQDFVTNAKKLRAMHEKEFQNAKKMLDDTPETL